MRRWSLFLLFFGSGVHKMARRMATRVSELTSHRDGIWVPVACVMRIGRSALAWCLLGASIGVSCGGKNGNAPAPAANLNGQILYVISNGTITTYSIDATSLDATAVERPVNLIPPSSLMQFDPSPGDHFLYTVWADGQNLQHLSVFQTDSSGVPQVPAIQVLNADSLSQFNMHPSGRFAYMLEVTNSNNGYQADIRLFHVQANGGTLKEDAQVQGIYGPAYYWPAFLYGFSADGRQLYDTSILATGSVYRERPINLKTGGLRHDTQLFSAGEKDSVVIGSRLIIDQYSSDVDANQSYVNVFPNTPNPRHALIHCTNAMLNSCATATNIQVDASSHFLFLSDPLTQSVHIASINLQARKITDTGSSIPMTSQDPGFAFSPDGTIVYAQLARDGNVHFYHFDRSTGSLTEGGTPLALASGSGICPAQYQ
jgi:DNA-binding beta-propeller fold protein YncE